MTPRTVRASIAALSPRMFAVPPILHFAARAARWPGALFAFLALPCFAAAAELPAPRSMLLASTSVAPPSHHEFPFQNPDLAAEERITDLLSRMTPDEKIACLGTNPSVPRLGVRGTGHVEGLHGLAQGGPGKWGGTWPAPSTQFPQSIGLGQTWDPELVREIAAAEALETRYQFQSPLHARGGLVVRAPNADLSRDPRWGRNEESFGEDAFLTGTMAVAFTRGLQGDDPRYLATASLLKHFLANSNEVGRENSSSNFDERQFHEYYAAPFRRAIVEGRAQGMMAAYNSYNGTPCTVHPMLREIVRERWGFDGILCTDGGAFRMLVTHHQAFAEFPPAAAACVRSGIGQFLDNFRADATAALAQGLMTEAQLDDVLRGNFRVMLRLGLLDPASRVPYSAIGNGEEPWDSAAHRALARRATQKQIVLLKNSGALLPLDRATMKSIAVIGPRADEVLLDWYSGTPPYSVSPLQGIAAALGGAAKVEFARDNAGGSAAALAARSDVAIVCLGNHPVCDAGWAETKSAHEGKESVDRREIALHPEQEQLLREVLAANARTVVVLVSNFPYASEWMQANAPAIVLTAHCSQELGHGLADVLFGEASPGGRLVQTWVKSLADLPPILDYDLRHGRTYMYFRGEPQYPFGFGLGYTTFAYEKLALAASTLRAADDAELKVHVTLRNTGARAGDEVVQLYVRHLGSNVERPRRELKAFRRVTLAAGETRVVELNVRAADLAYWDIATKRFAIERGKVEFLAGPSSAEQDLKLRAVVEVR